MRFTQESRSAFSHKDSGRASKLFSLGITLLLVVCGSVRAGTEQCFVPKPRESNSGEGASVDPKSAVCRAFEVALNNTCGGPIPIVEFKPGANNASIKQPTWQPISLFDKKGQEVKESFDLLETLVTARAMTRYLGDQEGLAKRDLSIILDRIQEARLRGITPRFEKTSVELAGYGRQETLYRIYSGLLSNPKAFDKDPGRVYGKAEPQLFLKRAIGLSTLGSRADATPSRRAGTAATRSPADVFIVNGVTYFMRWDGEKAALVYASYVMPNRAPSAGESRDLPDIFPTLQCIFEFHPNRALGNR